MGLSALLQLTIQHELLFDSRGIHDTITTLHDSKEYRLRQTVQRMRDSFESHDLDVLRWIRGIFNIADRVTKRNAQTWRLLSDVLNSGLLPELLMDITQARGDDDNWRAGITPFLTLPRS